LKSDSSDLIAKAKDAMAAPKEANELILPSDALRIIYFLISSDMELSSEELEMFDAIGADMDPAFGNHKDMIISECSAYMEQASDQGDYYDLIRDQITAALQSSKASSEGTIHPRLLIWNLISIAFADGDYSDNERRMIRSVVRLMNIDLSVMLEMEAAVQTLLAIEREEEFLKSSDRKYAEVELQMNEIADRKTVIMQSVQALMTD
jgi:uncharacterized tellurite resistance protein B-like protein